MGGKASRDKGHSFERRVAKDLREVFQDAKRGFQTRGGTKEEPDVDGTPFYIECKAHKKCNRKKAWKQADDAKAPGRIPVAVCKDDYKPITVTMLASDFFQCFGSAELLIHCDYGEWLALVGKTLGDRRT